MTGPTGIGMVKLFRAADETEDSGYTYTIKGAADELTPLLLQGELDIVLAHASVLGISDKVLNDLLELVGKLDLVFGLLGCHVYPFDA